MDNDNVLIILKLLKRLVEVRAEKFEDYGNDQEESAYGAYCDVIELIDETINTVKEESEV